MKRRSSSLLPATLVLAIAVALVFIVGCSAGTDEPFKGAAAPGDETTGPAGIIDGKITVASNIAYPPFEYSPKGAPRGFDIDLMNEVADRAGFKVRYRNVRFDSILRGLNEDLFDAAISAMTITKEREQQIDFSNPYFNADQALMVASYSEVQAMEDLTDAPVGVQAGSTGQIKAEELLDDGQIGEIKPYRTIGEAFAALRGGKVDGVIYDLSAAHREVVKSGGAIRYVESVSTGEQYGIAFPKDSPLVDPVNEALAKIKADGTYERLYKKWIGMPPEDIP
ncbi:MAG TPA: basic amino acid ABC transporter substrate-binding protein [Rubrobacter sp.]|nr:basic amino acid ABC transporter substrate-binding protein [Rubrobacter sp.]